MATYLTPNEIAKRLRVSHRKVMLWIRSGLLPALNVASPGSKIPHYRSTEEGLAALESRLTVRTPAQQAVRAKSRRLRKLPIRYV